MSPPDWATQLAAVVACPDGPALLQTLTELQRQSAPFTCTVIFSYHEGNRPVSLHDHFPASKRKVFMTDDQAGPYLLDPLYPAAERPITSGLYRFRDVAPDRFYQGEYYRNYYAQTGLAEEIGYFVDLPESAVPVLLLMRTERPFSHKEFTAFAAKFSVVASVARRQWAGLHLQFDHETGPVSPHRQRKRVADEVSRFGEGILTAREREIAEFTLKGHSAESAGQNPGISPETVRTHRRNIYSKLRINSQGELFSCFLATLLEEA